MCLLTGHFVKLKSVIFLLCNLEAISSNFIPVKFCSHTILTARVHTYIHTYIRGHAVGAGAPKQSLIALLTSPYAEIHHIEARHHSKLIH